MHLTHTLHTYERTMTLCRKAESGGWLSRQGAYLLMGLLLLTIRKAPPAVPRRPMTPWQLTLTAIVAIIGLHLTARLVGSVPGLWEALSQMTYYCWTTVLALSFLLIRYQAGRRYLRAQLTQRAQRRANKALGDSRANPQGS